MLKFKSLSLSMTALCMLSVSALAATPKEVVDLRMQLYNEHRTAEMLKLYADDFEVYTYPNKLMGKGKEHMRRVLEEIFADKSVHVTIQHQIVYDNYVINEELVSYTDRPTRYVSIYEVRDGLIKSLRFVRN